MDKHEIGESPSNFGELALERRKGSLIAQINISAQTEQHTSVVIRYDTYASFVPSASFCGDDTF